MGFLSAMRDERVALLGIGLAAGALITGMMALVSMVIEDNKIEHPAPKTQYITQETEDSLQLDTLGTLISHPSFSVREVAIKIVCDRAVNDPDALHMLLYGTTRDEYDHRLQCLKALALLLFQTAGTSPPAPPLLSIHCPLALGPAKPLTPCLPATDASTKLHEPKTYAALVRSLEVGLNDVENPPKLNDRYWEEYFLRDVAERTCLVILNELVQKNDAEMLVRAGFVSRWLARQNWGDSEFEVQNNFGVYKSIRRRTPVTDMGAAALRRAGLVWPEETLPYRGEVWGITFSSVPRGGGDGGPADSELSGEDLRRLRREAFVFNDGTRPISGADIIQRMPNS
jgi:hypothetical protein